MNVERILKNLRDNIVFRGKIQDQKMKYEIEHNHRNVIELESESTEDEKNN